MLEGGPAVSSAPSIQRSSTARLASERRVDAFVAVVESIATQRT
jgi:hypothetical protein